MSNPSKYVLDSIKQDQGRFQRIIKGKIKNQLNHIISEQQLIGRVGSKMVSIPLPKIEIPKFIFGSPSSGVGQGSGQVGQGVGNTKQQASGAGQAGNLPGKHLMEVDVDIDELTEILADQLELPRLKPKASGIADSQSKKYSSIAPTGPNSLRHFKRTFKRALKREISMGTYNPDDPLIIPIKRDFRYRHPKVTSRPNTNAVVIYMMDISGSMGGEQKNIVRTEVFWLDLWIEKHYQHVKKRYIVHDSSAKEATKDEFFHLKESGGTLISSAYKLCLEMMTTDYPEDEWNVYCFHFSDGDNWSQEDTDFCIDLMRKSLLPRVNLFGYGQVESRYGSGQFYRELQKYSLPEVVCSKIEDRNAIVSSIKSFFEKP